MAISTLPKTITKLDLFEEAQKRFQHWVDLYADPAVSAQHLYEDMSCSCYCGCPADDFPDDVKAEQDSTIKYQYKDGACSFTIDDIEVNVMDLRDMRKSLVVNKERYADICTLCIYYHEDDVAPVPHFIPDTWLYGSTSPEFDEGKPVHEEFINAARDFIKANHITPELQKYL